MLWRHARGQSILDLLGAEKQYDGVCKRQPLWHNG
jgi:hypothetical protein